MKKSENDRRTQFLKIRISAAELREVRRLQAQCTERSLSHYTRKLLLREPVTVKNRNASMDDLTEELIPIKEVLLTLQQDYQQAVDRLRMLEKIPEFRTWIQEYGSCHQQFCQLTAEVQTRLTQLYALWLPK
ncbi:MAG TPA: hypothetical protein VHK69_05415 [Chitinophagaceae bacterium]|jgi:transposase|nr:hypothetical protein [Chitinophagaceae bacterium]